MGVLYSIADMNKIEHHTQIYSDMKMHKHPQHIISREKNNYSYKVTKC